MVFLNKKNADNTKRFKINQCAKRTHKHKALVEFTLNYHEDLSRDSHFKHNSELYQYAIGQRLADNILTLFWKFIDMKKLVLFNIE